MTQEHIAKTAPGGAAPLELLERSMLGAAWVALAASPLVASAQATKESEIVEAIANTGQRIDIVGAKLAELGDKALELLPLLGVALITIIVFWFIARVLTHGDWLFRWIKNSFARDMVRQLARIAIVVTGILVALELLDATALVGAALGTAGIAGIAIGFAFRDIAENYLAGLLLSMRHPFEPNDLVAIDGDEGKVVRLTSRATVLLTLQGNHLRIPNAKVFKAVVLNYTRNPMRQFDFEVGVGVNEDLAAAQQLGCDVLNGMEAIVGEPPPVALLERLGDSSVPIHFYAWVDQRATNYFKAKSEAIRLVKTTFDGAGIQMPEPIFQLYVKRDAESPAAPMAQPGAQRLEAGDTAADDRLDAQVESERAAEGPDMLDEEAPLE